MLGYNFGHGKLVQPYIEERRQAAAHAKTLGEAKVAAAKPDMVIRGGVE